MSEIRILDDFLPNPGVYRAAALELDFRSFHFPAENETFHGISIAALDSLVPQMLRNLDPEKEPSLSFFRRSPAGQPEPHFIHTDVDMGEWTAILYLNPNPAPGDGTAFWTHEATGATGSLVPHERSQDGMSKAGWIRRGVVESRFNRLVIFPASLFHSRAIFENCGQDDSARLTQVTFLKGKQ